MKKHFTLAFLCLFGIYSFSQQAGDLIITEIMNNPKAVSDANGEWFEIYNTTNDTINLKGYKIEDLGTNKHTINSDLLIAPKKHFIFGKKADTLINGDVKVDYAFSFTLSNTEDEIIIKSPNDVVIDQVNYDKADGFPTPNGASLTLNIDYTTATTAHLDNDSANNWVVEDTDTYGDGDFGTPHYRNSIILFSFEPSNTIKHKILTISPTIITNQQLTVSHTKNIVLPYTIYSLQGSSIKSDTLTTNSATVLNLKSGVYFIKINDQTEKIIVE